MKKLLLILIIIYSFTFVDNALAEKIGVCVHFGNMAYTVPPSQALKEIDKITNFFKRELSKISYVKCVDIQEIYDLDTETQRYVMALDPKHRMVELARISGYQYKLSGSLKQYTEKFVETYNNGKKYETTVSVDVYLIDEINTQKVLYSFTTSGHAIGVFSKKLSRPKDAKILNKLRDKAIENAAVNIAKKISDFFSSENFIENKNLDSSQLLREKNNYYDIPVKYNHKNNTVQYNPINPNVKRIGIIEFNSKVKEVSDRQASSAENFFARMLSNSNSLAIFERERLNDIAKEHRLNLSGLIAPELAIKVGKLAGCQYILTGAVTEFSGKETKSKSDKKQIKYNDIFVTLDIRLINIETGEISLALSETGHASQSNRFSGNFLDSSQSSIIMLGGLVNSAIDDAASKLAPQLKTILTNESKFSHYKINHVNNDAISRLGVIGFTTRAEEIKGNDVISITNTLSHILANSKSITVIERERLDKILIEHKINLNDTNSVVKLGNLASCQYILFGSITSLSEKISKINNSKKGRYSELYNTEATATVDVRLIDVATGRVVLTVSKKGNADYSLSYSHGKSDAVFYSKLHNNKEQAAINAAIMIADEIREFFGEHSAIISINSREIKINRGTKSGIKNGDLFVVNNETGTILKVNNVRDDFSSVEVIKGRSSFLQRGDRIKLISRNKADDTL